MTRRAPMPADLADAVEDASRDLTRVSDLVANAVARGDFKRARTLLADLVIVHARLQGRLDEYLRLAQRE